MAKKKINRRSKQKYPALNPKMNPRIRQETIDFDYLHKLDKASLEFLNKFMEEENNASFTNTDRDLNKTKEDKRRLYNKNNARQRCLYSQKKSIKC